MKTKKNDMRGGLRSGWRIGKAIKRAGTKIGQGATYLGKHGYRGLTHLAAPVRLTGRKVGELLKSGTRSGKAQESFRTYGITNYTKLKKYSATATDNTARHEKAIANLKLQLQTLEQSHSLITGNAGSQHIKRSIKSIKSKIKEKENSIKSINTQSHIYQKRIRQALTKQKGLNVNLNKFTKKSVFQFNANTGAVIERDKNLASILAASQANYAKKQTSKKNDSARKIATQKKIIDDAEAIIKEKYDVVLEHQKTIETMPAEIAKLKAQEKAFKDNMEVKDIQRTLNADPILRAQYDTNLRNIQDKRMLYESNLNRSEEELAKAKKDLETARKAQKPIITQARKMYVTELNVFKKISGKAQTFDELETRATTGNTWRRFMNSPLTLYSKTFGRNKLLSKVTNNQTPEPQKEAIAKFMFEQYNKKPDYFDGLYTKYKERGEALIFAIENEPKFEELKAKTRGQISATMTLATLNNIKKDIDTNYIYKRLLGFIKARDTQAIIENYKQGADAYISLNPKIQSEGELKQKLMNSIIKQIPNYKAGEAILMKGSSNKIINLTDPTHFKNTLIDPLLEGIKPKLNNYLKKLKAEEQLKLRRKLGISGFETEGDLLKLLTNIETLKTTRFGQDFTDLKTLFAEEINMIQNPEIKSHINIISADARKQYTSNLLIKVGGNLKIANENETNALAELNRYQAIKQNIDDLTVNFEKQKPIVDTANTYNELAIKTQDAAAAKLKANATQSANTALAAAKDAVETATTEQQKAQDKVNNAKTPADITASKINLAQADAALKLANEQNLAATKQVEAANATDAAKILSDAADAAIIAAKADIAEANTLKAAAAATDLDAVAIADIKIARANAALKIATAQKTAADPVAAAQKLGSDAAAATATAAKQVADAAAVAAAAANQVAADTLKKQTSDAAAADAADIAFKDVTAISNAISKMSTAANPKDAATAATAAFDLANIALSNDPKNPTKVTEYAIADAINKIASATDDADVNKKIDELEKAAENANKINPYSADAKNATVALNAAKFVMEKNPFDAVAAAVAAASTESATAKQNAADTDAQKIADDADAAAKQTAAADLAAKAAAAADLAAAAAAAAATPATPATPADAVAAAVIATNDAVAAAVDAAAKQTTATAALRNAKTSYDKAIAQINVDEANAVLKSAKYQQRAAEDFEILKKAENEVNKTSEILSTVIQKQTDAEQLLKTEILTDEGQALQKNSNLIAELQNTLDTAKANVTLLKENETKIDAANKKDILVYDNINYNAIKTTVDRLQAEFKNMTTTTPDETLAKDNYDKYILQPAILILQALNKPQP